MASNIVFDLSELMVWADHSCPPKAGNQNRKPEEGSRVNTVHSNQQAGTDKSVRPQKLQILRSVDRPPRHDGPPPVCEPQARGRESTFMPSSDCLREGMRFVDPRRFSDV